MADTNTRYIITLNNGKPLPPARIVVKTSRYVIVDFGFGSQLEIQLDTIKSMDPVESKQPLEKSQPSGPPKDNPSSPQPHSQIAPDAEPATQEAPPREVPQMPQEDEVPDVSENEKRGPVDRLQPDSIVPSDDEPRLYVVVNGDKFPRPGLDTFFAEAAPKGRKTVVTGCSCDPVVATYCSCNKVAVCRCVSVCSCAGHRRCSCDSHTSSGTRVTGCRCAPVH